MERKESLHRWIRRRLCSKEEIHDAYRSGPDTHL